MSESSGQPSVLLVCTGNVCRSPAAMLLLSDGLGPGAGIAVTAAGLDAVTGSAVAEPMAALLRGRGLDPSAWRARQLVPETVCGADLVLTMTARQRADVVRRVPAAVRRTFTLREFAELALLVRGELPESEPAGRLAALLGTVPAARARRLCGDDGRADWDIEDPYGRGEEVNRRVLDRIAAAVAAVVATLRPVGAATC